MNRHSDIEKRDFEDLLNKQFLGVVELIDDPRKEGRARVRVYSIHDDLATEDLPWAYPKNKSVFFGADGKSGSISIPKKGSLVAVRFDNGNPYSPEYFAIHELAQDVKDELNDEYEGSHIILFDGDQELKIWFSVGKGLTISVKEASVNIAPDSLITVKTTNKVVVDSPSIELGEGAAESLVFGDTFQKLFNSHTHQTPAGPSTPPSPLMNPTHLSKISKTK